MCSSDLFDSGREAAAELLELEVPPTVIMASNDDMAAGALIEARKRGIDVPSGLSVTGFDDTPLASHTWPQLTTVRQPISEMAQHAAQLLIAGLADQSVSQATERFDCEVVVRGSTAPPKA
mgnify:CR=1 FL=1